VKYVQCTIEQAIQRQLTADPVDYTKVTLVPELTSALYGQRINFVDVPVFGHCNKYTAIVK
jgi:hypothetical protein